MNCCPICKAPRMMLALDLPEDEMRRRLSLLPPFQCDKPDDCEGEYLNQQYEAHLKEEALDNQ